MPTCTGSQMMTGVDTLGCKVLFGHTTSDITFSLYGRNALSTEHHSRYGRS